MMGKQGNQKNEHHGREWLSFPDMSRIYDLKGGQGYDDDDPPALTFIIFNTDYMASRIHIWQDPWSDPLGKGFQTILRAATARPASSSVTV